MTRRCEAWESLGNRESRCDDFDDFDHDEVIYDQPSDGDGADNDFEYAMLLIADVARIASAFGRRERSGQRGAAFVWGYALLGACSCAQRHGLA